MQMGFDIHEGARGSTPLGQAGLFGEPWRADGGPAGPGLAPVHPDWSGIRARFVALHALRRSIESATVAAIPAGSFMAAGRAVLACARGETPAVNPICSGNGKAVAGMFAWLSPTVPRAATEDQND
jgi:hypothetical protein